MPTNLGEIAERVRTALADGDLDAYEGLLAPRVHWGPPDQPEWGCHNRREVLTWYKNARRRGMRATVDDVIPGIDCLLVGLTVEGGTPSDDVGGAASRWQVLTIEGGLIADICGFDDRERAASRAGISG